MALDAVDALDVRQLVGARERPDDVPCLVEQRGRGGRPGQMDGEPAAFVGHPAVGATLLAEPVFPQFRPCSLVSLEDDAQPVGQVEGRHVQDAGGHRIRLRGRLVLPAGDAVVVPELRAQGTDLLGADRAVLVEHGDRQGAFQLHVRHVVLEGVLGHMHAFRDLVLSGRKHKFLIGGVPVLRPLDEADDRTGAVLVDVGVHRLAAELGVCGFHAFLVLEHEDMPALLVLSDAARAQRGTGLLRKPGEGPLVSIRKIGQRAARSFPVDDVDPDARHAVALHVPDGLRVFLVDGMEPAILVLVDVEWLALAGLVGGGRLSGSFSPLDCRDILLGRNQAVGADGIDVGHITRALEAAVGV